MGCVQQLLMSTVCIQSIHSLTTFPKIQALLESSLQEESAAPDSPERLEQWVATRLMALWRDKRTSDVFEALYSFSQASVISWIRSLLSKQRSGLDAREVLQDTFVNVFRYPKSFRDEHVGSFRVWVRTIAGNLIKRAKRPSALRAVEYPEGWQEPADSRTGPAEEVAMGDEAVRMRAAWQLFLLHYARAFQELGERDQRALRLVEVECLAYRDAGARLGVTRSNMKMIVFRARRRLAHKMRVAMAIELRRLAA